MQLSKRRRGAPTRKPQSYASGPRRVKTYPVPGVRVRPSLPLLVVEAAVIEGGHLATQPVLAVEVQLGDRDAFSIGDLGQDRAPGVHDDRVSVGGASLAEGAGLGGRALVGEAL